MIRKHTTFVEKDIRGINPLLYKKVRAAEAFLSSMSGEISTFPHYHNCSSVIKEMAHIPHLSDAEIKKLLNPHSSFETGEVFLKSSMASHRTEGLITEAMGGSFDLCLRFSFFEKEKRVPFHEFHIIFERSGSVYCSDGYAGEWYDRISQVFHRLANRTVS